MKPFFSSLIPFRHLNLIVRTRFCSCVHAKGQNDKDNIINTYRKRMCCDTSFMYNIIYVCVFVYANDVPMCLHAFMCIQFLEISYFKHVHAMERHAARNCTANRSVICNCAPPDCMSVLGFVSRGVVLVSVVGCGRCVVKMIYVLDITVYIQQNTNTPDMVRHKCMHISDAAVTA